ncbi:MAG: biliverdin-producing heme oxygenase, partial [Myxococcota bacterium]
MTQPVSLMERLRTATRPAHDALDRLPYSQALMAGPVLRCQLLSHVAAEALIQHHLEAVLSAHPHPSLQQVWSGRRRAPLLHHDRERLQSRTPAKPDPYALSVAMALAHQFEAWARTMPHRLLGALYVMEGSTLGAVVIAQRLRQHHPEESDALTRFAPYPEGVGLAWKAFKRRMNALELSSTQQDHAIAGARQTFHRFHQIMTRVGHLTAPLHDTAQPPASSPKAPSTS